MIAQPPSGPPSGDWRIGFTDFPAQFPPIRDQVLAVLDRVMSSGHFILGEEVQRFEDEFAAYCGVPHAVGVANGTDALVLAFTALGIGAGDEVITVANTFIATVASIVRVGARPVLIDVRPDRSIDPERFEAAATSRTRAVVPVHLDGRCADMDAILQIARKRNLAVVEDAAQAVGAERNARRAGSFGVLGCFSMHPLKNLNAMGDAGVVTTPDLNLAQKLRCLRNHGLKSRDEVTVWGFNSRLDTVQAAILRIRLARLESLTNEHRRQADRYRRALSSVVEVPQELPHERPVYHRFVIQCDLRDELRAYLEERGIETKVHYPIPIHLQECARSLGYRPGDFPHAERQASRILSLPLYAGLADADIDSVVGAIHEFFEQRAVSHDMNERTRRT